MSTGQTQGRARAAGLGKPGTRAALPAALLAALLALLIALLLAVPASADTSIGGEAGTGPGQLRALEGIGVSTAEGGDLYLPEQDLRVSQFDPSKAPGEQFVRAFGWGVVPGALTGSGNLTKGSTAVTAAIATSGAFVPGQLITGAGIAPGTTVASIRDSVALTEIKLSKPAEATATGVTLSAAEAPGNVPVDERKTLTLGGSPSGGVFSLTFITPRPSPIAATLGGPITATAGAGSNVLTSVQGPRGTGNLSGNTQTVEALNTSAGAFRVGQTISGPGIPPNTTIIFVNEAGHKLTLSNPAETSQTSAPLSASLTLAPGQGISGPGIPAHTTIASVDEAAHELTLSSPAEVSQTARLEVGVPYDASSAQLQALLEGLPNIGSGNVAASGAAGGPWTVEFTGRWSDVAIGESNEVGELESAANLFFANAAGLTPSGTATIATARKGAATLETCTASCRASEQERGSGPGQFRAVGPLAVDDSGGASDGDLYVIDSKNFRIEKFDPEGHFLLMFGGGVDQGPHHPGDLCTAAYLAEGDSCGAGAPGTGPSHFYKEEPQTEAGGFKSWANRGSNSIAVGPDGTVYVGDYGRIQEFEPGGAFKGEIALTETEPKFVSALAIAPSGAPDEGDVFERSATYSDTSLVSQIASVREYGLGPGHAFLRSFDTEEPSSDPTHIALDQAGDLFVSEHGLSEFQFRGFRPSGALYAEFSSSLLGEGESEGERLRQPTGIAVGAGQLYATAHVPLNKSISNGKIVQDFGAPERNYAVAMPLPLEGPPLLSGESASNVEPKTATLHAVVNPKQLPTEYHFEYTTTNFANCGEPANPDCHNTPTTSLGSIDRRDPVAAAISGLEPQTTYHYRAVAESTFGGDTTVDGTEQSFQTLPPVAVRDFAPRTVAPEEVVLAAKLSPDNSATATHYSICYGEDTTYAGGCVSGTLKVHNNEFEEVTATFTGLEPNTTYHYRLSAENEFTPSGHPLQTADATFTTEPSAAEKRAAEDCPENGSIHGAPGGSALREQNNSLALPDCRAYEQVSPAYKAGFRAFGAYMAPSGERVLFGSNGAFGGAPTNQFTIPYISHRTGSGWVTQPAISQPAGPGYQPGWLYTLSPELDRWVFPEQAGANVESSEEAGSAALYLATPAGALAQPSPTLSVLEPQVAGQVKVRNFTLPEAAADDLSRLYIGTDWRLLAEDPRSTDPRSGGFHNVAGSTRIYEVAGLGGPSPALRWVTGVATNLSAPQCVIDHRPETGTTQFHRRVSADGATLFYTAPLDNVGGSECGEGSPNPYGLFARTAPQPGGPATTVRLNEAPASQCSSPHPCAGALTKTAIFSGASPDGRLAWFTTSQPLIDSDADEGRDLYLARLSEFGQLEELVQASAGGATPSHPTPGAGAGVQGVVKVSQDGTHAAFVATGVLTAEPNSTGVAAAAGADNLYVYEAASSEIHFVARLCSAAGESGSVAEPACPETLSTSLPTLTDQGLWTQETNEAHFTPNGDYLVFAAFGRLAAGDTDNALDIYRYRFADGAIQRLSFGYRGNDANGNGAHEAAIAPSSQDEETPLGGPRGGPYQATEDGTRPISADGAVVVFTTAAPLVSYDTNEAEDVYEWEERGHGSCTEAGGCVSLISDGVDPHGATNAIVSSSGKEILFTTPRGEVPADTDGVDDVYVAKVNGGFPPPPRPEICGGAETCHGSVTEDKLPINPVTEGVEHGPEPIKRPCKRGYVRRHGHCVKVRKHHHRQHKRRHKRAARASKGGKK